MLYMHTYFSYESRERVCVSKCLSCSSRSARPRRALGGCRARRPAPERTRFLFYVIVRIAFPDFQRSRIILRFKYTTVHFTHKWSLVRMSRLLCILRPVSQGFSFSYKLSHTRMFSRQRSCSIRFIFHVNISGNAVRLLGFVLTLDASVLSLCSVIPH